MLSGTWWCSRGLCSAHGSHPEGTSQGREDNATRTQGRSICVCAWSSSRTHPRKSHTHIPGVVWTGQPVELLEGLGTGYLRAWEQDIQEATGIWEAARGYPTSPHSLPGPSGFLSLADEGTHPIGLCRKQPGRCPMPGPSALRISADKDQHSRPSTCLGGTLRVFEWGSRAPPNVLHMLS